MHANRRRRITVIALAASIALGAALSLVGGRGGAAVRAQPPGAGPPPSACGLRILEDAPAAARVCDPVSVTVTMQVTRPQALPLHVVFVIAKHLLMFDHLEEAKAVARDAVGALEFTDQTLAGVVSLSVQGRTELELTNRRGDVVSAINGLRLDQVQPTARYYDWLAEAEDLLARARSEAVSPVEVIVLISTGCPVGFESYCSRQEASASRVQGKGIQVLGVCNPNAAVPPPALPRTHCNAIRALASQGGYFDLRQSGRVQDRLVEIETAGKEVQPVVVQLLERLAPGFGYVAGSAAGLPADRLTKMERNADRMLWAWTGVPADGWVTATYRVQPLAEGELPLRLGTSVGLVEDRLGRTSPGQAVPLRSILVGPCAPPTPTATEAPTATPSPPATATARPSATATATPQPSPTPSATPIPPPSLAYLPLGLLRACRPSERFADVALVIDASSSMTQDAGGVSRLASAQAAARRFLDLVDLAAGRDQVALATFSGEARLMAPLGSSRPELEAALGAIALGRGTRLDQGLAAAEAALTGPARRPRNQPVIVLLSDGQPDAGSEGAALEAAARAKAMGVELYMIGFGGEAGAELLARLASRPENFLSAPGSAELAAVYERVAGDLPCPGGLLWAP